MMQLHSYFRFSKAQRQAIFLLLSLVVVFQGVYFLMRSPDPDIPVDQSAIEAFRLEVDSLRAAEVERRKPRLYPFNPNFITDYRGYVLGMSNEEIDRLLDFRAKGLWINSKKEFQAVTGISDTLLEKISPFFKFPEWISRAKTNSMSKFNSHNVPKSFDQKKDLNLATAGALKRINGIGDVLSRRIVKYRDKFDGGFIADVQLRDIYGLSPEVMARILNDFTVKTPRQVTKRNLNLANTEELVTIQHIDYELAYDIVEYRTLHEGFRSLDELKKVKGFPVNKFEIIELYLTLD
jgi:DNA uptake protein ComE-like DNA-binding protein